MMTQQLCGKGCIELLNKKKLFSIMLCFAGMLGCQLRTYQCYDFSNEVFATTVGTLKFALDPTYSVEDEAGKRISIYQSPYRMVVQFTSTAGDWNEFELTDLVFSGLEDDTTVEVGTIKGVNMGNRRQDLDGLYFGAFETQPIELKYQSYNLRGTLIIRKVGQEVSRATVSVIFKTDYKKKMKSDIISAMEGI